MYIIKCNIHNVNYKLPETNAELLSGKFHADIISCQDHVEKFPDCVMVEIINE